MRHLNKATAVISKLLWLACGLACCGGAILFATAFLSTSAPQQGAAGALAACCAVIPYVVARSWDELTARGDA